MYIRVLLDTAVQCVNTQVLKEQGPYYMGRIVSVWGYRIVCLSGDIGLCVCQFGNLLIYVEWKQHTHSTSAFWSTSSDDRVPANIFTNSSEVVD